MSNAFRAALLASAIIAPAMPALASADAAPERDYLPTEIVVTGAKDGYGDADGTTGTKTPTPLVDVPQTVTFITEDQLEDQSVRQLGEALRYVPGVSLETGEGHRDEIFIRGQETTADFYIDGLRDDAQYYRSLYNISRVEVLKGANALIFGRGGGGGVVNRVSKRATFSDAFTQGEASVDTFGAFAGVVDVNQPVTDSVALRLSATYEEFNSHRDFYDGSFIGISPTITADLGPATTLTAHYTYDEDNRLTDRGVPAFNGGPLRGFDETLFGDRDFNDSDVEAHIARTRLEHEFSGTLSANASVQYANYDKTYANILPRGTDGISVQLGGYADATQRENLYGQANLVWQVDTGPARNTLLLGIEAGTQDTQNQRWNVSFTGTDTAALADLISIPEFTTAQSRSRDSNLGTFSAYIQNQLNVGDHIEVIAGLRFDRFDLDTVDLISGVDGSRVDQEVSPRVGLIFKPQEELSFYVSYAESFLPQAGDQFLLLSPTDAAFEPEQFRNYEIGAKWAVRPGLLATASIFRLDRENTRAPDPANTGLTLLTGASRVEGFEASVIGEITPFWEASLGYTYLDGEITETTSSAAAGTRLQQLPEHQISAWNRFNFTDRFGIGLGVIYQDEQFTSFSNQVVLPDYWRVDTAAFFDVNEKVSLQVNIENLFDATYYPSAHGDNNIQPGEPFSARFGVRVKI